MRNPLEREYALNPEHFLTDSIAQVELGENGFVNSSKPNGILLSKDSLNIALNYIEEDGALPPHLLPNLQAREQALLPLP